MTGMVIPTIPTLPAGSVVQLADLQNLAYAAQFALGKPMAQIIDNVGGLAIGTSFGSVGFTDPVFDPDGMWTQSITGVNSTFEGGNGNWVAGANTAVANTAAQAHGGANSLSLTSAAAGNIQAQSCNLASFATQAIPVTPGALVAVSAWYRAATVARSVITDVIFLNASGGTISVLGGTSVTNSTTAWTRQQSLLVAPALSAWAVAQPAVISTAAANEVHYVDDVQLTPAASRLTVQTPGWYTARYGINVGTIGGTFTSRLVSTTGANNPAGAGVVSAPFWAGYTDEPAASVGWATGGGDWPFYLFPGDYIEASISAAAAGASTGINAPGSGTTTPGSYFSLELVSI